MTNKSREKREKGKSIERSDSKDKVEAKRRGKRNCDRYVVRQWSNRVGDE